MLHQKNFGIFVFEIFISNVHESWGKLGMLRHVEKQVFRAHFQSSLIQLQRLATKQRQRCVTNLELRFNKFLFLDCMEIYQT